MNDKDDTSTGQSAKEVLSAEPTHIDPPTSGSLSKYSDTPLPSKPKPLNPKQPSSLDSIYNSLTPIPEVFRQAREESLPSNSKTPSPAEAETMETKSSNRFQNQGEDFLSETLTTPLIRLASGHAIEEIHCVGAHRLSCRVKGSIRSLTHEQPFSDLQEAYEVNDRIRRKLSPLEGNSAVGRINDFWVSAHREIMGEPHLCMQRLAPIVTQGVIEDDLMPQLGKFMSRGARFVIASPVGERRAAESVAATILQHYGQTERYGLVGLQRHLGDAGPWIELGSGDQALKQAASLCLDGLVVGDHPSLSGGLIFDVMSDLSSSMVLINARNPEGAFHKVRWRSAHKHLAAATVNMIIFAKEIEGQPKLSSIHSYTTGEKVYQLPRS